MLLSIIIPVYNAEKFIERCVNSIIDQAKDFSDIELVIINDGSTDKSPQILKRLQDLYPIIILYDQQNSGEGHTRNVGLEKAKGDYIWFIDADDYIEGTVLNNIHKTLVNQKPETILFGYKSVDLEGEKLSEVKYEDAVLTADELISKSLYSNTVWSKVINRNLIRSNKLSFDPTVKTATDFDFSFRVLYYSEKIAMLNDVSYNYVVNPDSISNIRTREHLEKLAKDSVIVASNIKEFLIINEKDYEGRMKIFKPWLNNYLYGLLFSVFRFNYSITFIEEIIKSLKENNNYPVNTSKMNTKKKLFMAVANHESLFLMICRMNRKLKKQM